MDNNIPANQNNPTATELSASSQSGAYYRFSGFGSRLLAFIVDGVLALAIGFVLTLIIETLTKQPYNFGKGSSFQTISGLISVIYFVIFTYKYGATLGKMLVHIRVVNTNYQRLSFFQVLKREVLGRLISSLFLSLGYIWVAIDDKKQAWHDKIAKTYVIHTEPITQSEHIALQENKRSNFPIVLVIAGLVESILPLINTFFIVPNLSVLYAQASNNGYNYLLTYSLFGIIIVLSLAQIIYGIMLWSTQKKTGMLANNQKSFAKALLIIGIVASIFVVPIMILTVILPIYRLTTSF